MVENSSFDPNCPNLVKNANFGSKFGSKFQFLIQNLVKLPNLAENLIKTSNFERKFQFWVENLEKPGGSQTTTSDRSLTLDCLNNNDHGFTLVLH